MRMNEHPKGAILTESALHALIPANGGEVAIYSVNGVLPNVSELILTSSSVITTNESNFRQISYRTSWGESYHCLGDWNIGANHNASYVFANKADAEAHRDFMKSDPEMIEQRLAHLEECRRWDDLYDRVDCADYKD